MGVGGFLHHLRYSAGDGHAVTGDGFKRCACGGHYVVIGASRLAGEAGIKQVRRAATPLIYALCTFTKIVA